MNEKEKIELVRKKVLRIVSPQRKRKLQRRGIAVHWDVDLWAFIWKPNWHK
ncbi:hypothetical protein [Methylobacter sp.]|uniref:hypothetical protein n=1 Tax=Methylobacter sp. TaxID=2051955 RepID=UPI002612D7B3|nr:hypothetical protein [Methylobacter sp.]